MISPQTELILWAVLDVGGFALAVWLAYLRMRRTPTARQELQRATESLVAYGVIVSLAYAAWYYLGDTFTLYGSILFGCISSGLHVVLLAIVLLILLRVLNRE